mgnify:CR=1 FL=1|tara:strand:- start:441 stop:725 length:285 start_codon:yes stop_codon:yes gene_type:complete
MFEGLEQIAAPKGVVGKDGLRRVGWAELAAAISLSRNLRGGEQGLLAQAGPSFDNTEPKEERGINPRSLASGKAPELTDGISATPTPRRHREKP